MSIRKAAVAGYFYPKNSIELKNMVNKFIDEAIDVKIPGKLKGLIVPHAGYMYSGSIAAVGYRLLRKQEKNKIIIIGPSHFIPFIGVSISTHDYWETPLGRVKVQKIKSDFFIDFPQAHEKEHSIEVQIPFLQICVKNLLITPIAVGDAHPKEITDALIPLIDDSTIIIVSSDLSHYHTYEKAKILDGMANKFIPKLDIENVESKVEACGKTGILALMNLAKKMKWNGKKLFYANSGDITGDKGQVVGYGCYAFYEKN